MSNTTWRYEDNRLFHCGEYVAVLEEVADADDNLGRTLAAVLNAAEDLRNCDFIDDEVDAVANAVDQVREVLAARA